MKPQLRHRNEAKSPSFTIIAWTVAWSKVHFFAAQSLLVSNPVKLQRWVCCREERLSFGFLHSRCWLYAVQSRGALTNLVFPSSCSVFLRCFASSLCVLLLFSNSARIQPFCLGVFFRLCLAYGYWWTFCLTRIRLFMSGYFFVFVSCFVWFCPAIFVVDFFFVLTNRVDFFSALFQDMSIWYDHDVSLEMTPSSLLPFVQGETNGLRGLVFSLVTKSFRFIGGPDWILQ